MHTHDDQQVIPALKGHLEIPRVTPGGIRSYHSAPEVDLNAYDHIVLCMSGGKDSIACLLHLIDQGVDRSRLELWHHEVDGREGSTLMDWAFMADYNRKLAAHFGLPLYFSWLEGGFEGEMLKHNGYSRPHHIETPDGTRVLERDTARARPATRLRFPQVSASLQARWCSSALKIDVGRRALNNQARFEGKKVLFITGERREESANRARYHQLEPHACDRRDGRKARHVDAWRAVLHWDEARVWDALARHGIVAPVPYRLGWSRSSCMKCIFNEARIWATLQHYFPGSLDSIADYEARFGATISRSRKNVLALASEAQPMPIEDHEALTQALQQDYRLAISCDPLHWRLPVGAFAQGGCGPS